MNRTTSFEKDYDAGDVVDTVLFSLPSRDRLLHDCAAGALKVIAVPKGYNQVDNLVIRKEFPHAI